MKEISFDFNSYVEKNARKIDKIKQVSPAEPTKSSGRAKRRKAQKIIGKVAAVAREVLDIYSAVKRKDPISITLGALSAYGCISELFEGQKSSAQERLKEIGAVKAFPMMSSFIFNTFQQMDVPMRRIWTENKEEGEDIREGIEEFDLGDDVKVWFINPGSDDNMEGPEHGPYVKDVDAFVSQLSKTVEEKMGKILAINSIVKGWNEIYYLGPIRIPTALYVSQVDEKDMMSRITNLQNLGFNRSILFFGAPGIGKTTLAAKIAEEMKGRLLVASSNILEAGRGRTIVEELTDLLDPAVILLDDLDKMWRPNELLNSMERLNNKVGSRKRLIIGTVNTLGDIPEPLRRPGRFDEIVEFKSLTTEQRRKIIEVYTKEFKVSLTNKQLDKLAKISNNMTGAYLKEIAKRTSVVSFDHVCLQVAQMKRICQMIEEPEKPEEAKNKRTKTRPTT